MTEKFYRVEVHDHDGLIVAIEPSMLSGREIGAREDEAIRCAIQQLRGFIGSLGSPAEDAAPDLLAACRAFVAALDDTKFDVFIGSPAELIRLAEAREAAVLAIAKAEGR